MTSNVGQSLWCRQRAIFISLLVFAANSLLLLFYVQRDVSSSFPEELFLQKLTDQQLMKQNHSNVLKNGISVSSNKADIPMDDSVNITICKVNTLKPLLATSEVSCSLILQNNHEEMNKAEDYMQRNLRDMKPSKLLLQQTSNCDKLREGYLTCAMSEEEKKYPIAYSILCHKDVEQVERLLKSIYQPQNVYCIHPDEKADETFHEILHNIANCFSNVFIVSKIENVVYASYTRLKAELNCIHDLLKRREKWKYYINLAGQVFPLKTNREIVDIMKVYNGANDIEGQNLTDFISSRVKFIHKIRKYGKIQRIVQTKWRKTDKLPANLTLVKGSAYGVFSKEFLEYVTTDEVANRFRRWSSDTRTPDEHYWATLNHLYHNPFLKSPGGYIGKPSNKPWLASYSSWQNHGTCHGRYVHYVCIFGIKDLPMLINRKELFVNKLFMNFQHLTYSCLEEYIRNRTIYKSHFDLSYYKKLPFIRKSIFSQNNDH